MTIGIAASGRWAGTGVLAGLRAVEAVGRGAIGGFVSLAVLTEGGRLVRAETQTGGANGLFADAPPEEILKAPLAALISSGPDRPAPLSQFIAADSGVGLVTGHRFPQAMNADGQPLNAAVLAAMRSGTAPQQAVDDLIKAAPDFDAGFIALSKSGAFGIGNMPSVLRRADNGAAHSICAETAAQAAALHNAIQPHRAIGVLATEVTLDAMRSCGTVEGTITLGAGLRLEHGPRPEIHVDAAGGTVKITHPEARALQDEISFGMGDRVPVLREGRLIGWLGHEPFMVVRQSEIVTWDGKAFLNVPVLMRDG